MDEKLKRLTQALGEAIDQAINESGRIKELTDQLRAAGYETILMVEANICFARCTPTLGGETSNKLPEDLIDMMSRDDHQFLKSLKISVGEIDNDDKQK
ncbi:MAG: hypothetical protein AB1489_14005 [Acidobacteriota bacterium]